MSSRADVLLSAHPLVGGWGRRQLGRHRTGHLLHATEPGLVAPNADTVKVINNDA